MASFLFVFFTLVVFLILVIIFAAKTYQDLEIAKRNLYRYKHLASQEEYQDALTSDIEHKKRQQTQLTEKETEWRALRELF